jgi:hypothetical protein
MPILLAVSHLLLLPGSDPASTTTKLTVDERYRFIATRCAISFVICVCGLCVFYGRYSGLAFAASEPLLLWDALSRRGPASTPRACLLTSQLFGFYVSLLALLHHAPYVPWILLAEQIVLRNRALALFLLLHFFGSVSFGASLVLLTSIALLPMIDGFPSHVGLRLIFVAFYATLPYHDPKRELERGVQFDANFTTHT